MNIYDIDIKDIAKSLSHQGRFLGHTNTFYSVAQHCLIGALELRNNGLDIKTQLAFLLHDAAEAYLCDIPSPLKHSEVFHAYRQIEDALQYLIYRKFNIDVSGIEMILKDMDMRLMFTEKRDLRMCNDKWEDDEKYPPLNDSIKPMLPTIAYDAYLDLYDEIANILGIEND